MEEFLEIKEDAISFLEKIHDSPTCTIHKGVWENGRQTVQVAVKATHIRATELPDPVLTVLSKIVSREAQMLNRCRHPSVLRLFGVCSEASSGDHYLITEHLPRGNMRTILDAANQDLPWSLKYKFAMDVAEAVAHIHTCGIVHRDIKAENVIISEDWVAKLCDFGFARGEENEGLSSTEMLTADVSAYGRRKRSWTLCGTAEFMAPELRMGQRNYDEAVDVFSLGVFLLEAATGLPPHDETFRRGLENDYSLDVEKIKSCVDDAASELFNIAKACCSFDPILRPSASTVASSLRNAIKKWDSHEISSACREMEQYFVDHPLPEFGDATANDSLSTASDASCGKTTTPGYGAAVLPDNSLHGTSTKMSISGSSVPADTPQEDLSCLKCGLPLVEKAEYCRRCVPLCQHEGGCTAVPSPRVAYLCFAHLCPRCSGDKHRSVAVCDRCSGQTNPGYGVDGKTKNGSLDYVHTPSKDSGDPEDAGAI